MSAIAHKRRPARSQIVEVARSFSYKLNAGNYESREFFCSQKAECWAEEAAATSENIHAFCKSQVMRAVREYKEEAISAQREAEEAQSRVLVEKLEKSVDVIQKRSRANNPEYKPQLEEQVI